MPKIELLAPAKDRDIALAAINFGADAVYMGGPSFGARSQAGNDIAGIADVVRHAHTYGAKVYVTVNTLLFDGELAAARCLIGHLYDMGTDAVIIQDMGLLTGDLPPVAVHASTQMHNNTPEKLRFLADIGVKRAVLPREFSLVEIAQMAAAVPEVELETFIHGALCVSYSGQCYFSYAVGGRSANRGECAQPCRKLYSLSNAQGLLLAKDKYLLSLKDLCLSGHLAALMDAGVTSFKIEGRLKNIDYVKNTVAFYRQEIDAILTGRPDWRKASSGRVYFDFAPDVNKTFNRLYTAYFSNGRRRDITRFATPKALGERLGAVRSSRNGRLMLDSAVELHAGDGLCWLEDDRLRGANLNRSGDQGVELQNVTAIPLGTEVFRNYDHAYHKLLEQSRTCRKVAFDLRAVFVGKELSVSALDEDGVQAELVVAEDFIVAKDVALAKANLRKAFAKQGDTIFELRGFAVQGVLPFLTMSRLNALRRELMELLLVHRLAFFRPKAATLNLGAAVYPVKQLDFNANVVNKAATAFYAAHGAQVMELGAESGLDLTGRVVMTTRHCLRYSLGLCDQSAYQEDLWLIDDKGHKYRLLFDCENCLMKIVY